MSLCVRTGAGSRAQNLHGRDSGHAECAARPLASPRGGGADTACVPSSGCAECSRIMDLSCRVRSAKSSTNACARGDGCEGAFVNACARAYHGCIPGHAVSTKPLQGCSHRRSLCGERANVDGG